VILNFNAINHQDIVHDFIQLLQTGFISVTNLFAREEPERCFI